MSADFKQTLWKAADKLRAQMDAGEYKHIVLGLIFLKYISDTFAKQQDKVKEMVSAPSSDYFVSEDVAEYGAELEDRDYYTLDNVFWVPPEARWENLRSKAKQPDIGSLIDDAMTAIENENTSLRGKLDKRFGRAQLGQGVLGELIDLISTIGFADKYASSDLLGEVYEYFLGQFASAEGKKGGQFYTPSHVVKTLVAVLSPNSGRVYDPCCGSGGMFVQSEEFVKAHGGRVDDISIYGQESNPTTWRLAAMNLAIRGFAADLGKEPADTFARDQFPDVKFDYIMANPPFNISDWGGEKYESDPRWQFGRPPVGNANYAWLQHILWKLRPGGRAGIVLANGSLNSPDEKNIRREMIQNDVVEAIIVLPSHLFVNTNIGVSLWFLTNDKNQMVDRREKVLFVDARKMGDDDGRTKKVLSHENILSISSAVEFWRTDQRFENIVGFAAEATLKEIEERDWNLEAGSYVGFDSAEEFSSSSIEINEHVSTVVELTQNIINSSDSLKNKLLNSFDIKIENLISTNDSFKSTKSIIEPFECIQAHLENIYRHTKMLEELKTSLIRSWFIEFMPSKLLAAKENTGLNFELLSKFPNEFVESEVGNIPRGWCVVKLSQLFIERKEKVGDRSITEYSCTNKGVVPREEKFSKKLSKSIEKNKVAYKGDFIFGLSRSLMNFGMLEFESGCFSPAYKVYRMCGDYIVSVYLYEYMKLLPDYFYQIVSASSREGQKISEESFDFLHIVMPPEIRERCINLSVDED